MKKVNYGVKKALAVFLTLTLILSSFAGALSVNAAAPSLRYINYYSYLPPYFDLLDTEDMKSGVMVCTSTQQWLEVDENGGSADFDFEVRYSDGTVVPIVKTKVCGVTDSAVALKLDEENIKAGEYTVKATSKKDPEQAPIELKITLYNVVFHPGDGKFASGEDTFTAVVAAGAGFSYINIPELTLDDASGREFIGWSALPGQTDYSNLLYTVPADVGDLYAVFGSKKTWRSEVQDESGVKISSVDFGNLGHGEEPVSKEIYLKNTGTEEIYDVTLRNKPNYFDVSLSLPNSNNKMQAGQKAVITITPKAGLGIGTYKETLGVGPRTGIWFIDLIVSVGQKEVTILPGTVTKTYGETLDASDFTNDNVKVLTKNGAPANVDFESLGVTLASDGFSAGAEAGEYAYTIETAGNGDYRISLNDNAGKVVVEKAVPEGTANATGLYEGDMLSDEQLSGTFANPYHPEWPVTGSLKWEKTEEVTETAKYKWVFTPDEDYSKNYTNATGEAEVIVSDRTPTKIIPVDGDSSTTTFFAEYDGNEHGLSFTTDRPSSVGGEVKVQYAPKGTENWTDVSPKKAGVYSVLATVDENGSYAEGSFDAELTIEKREIAVDYTAENKEYDGDRTANVSLTITNKANGDDVSVSALSRFEDANAANGKAVTIRLVTLSGKDADNYKLPTTVYHTTADITPKEVSIKIKDGKTVRKYYGELGVISADLFEAVGVVKGESIANLNVQFASEGTAAQTDVGEYDITADIESRNYTLKNSDAGKLIVDKATPVLREDIHVGEGYKTGRLGDVALTGEFVNPYNSSMAVKGKLEWIDPDTVLPSNANTVEAKWKFTLDPEFEKNYNEPEITNNNVTVNLTDKKVFNIKVSDVTLPYNGQGQEYNGYTIPDGFNINVVCRYQQVDSIRANGVDPNAWSAEKPVDAGIYAVEIKAAAGEYSDEYADFEMIAHMTISQAAPEIEANNTVIVREGTRVEEIPIAEGFKKPKDINGEELTGRYIWEVASSEPVTKDGSVFEYTFIPDNANYSNVQGSVTVNLAEDHRVIMATVYNLPEELGYHDYAVVNIIGSELRVGDELVFYNDKDCSNAESEPYIVSVDDMETGKVTIDLDADALEDNDLILYARVANSQKHEATKLSYKPELGITVDDSFTVEGVDKVLSGEYTDESYAELLESCSFILEGADYVQKSSENAKELSVTLKGIEKGSTILTITASFKHPDPENHDGKLIVITKLVNVTSLAHTHKGVLVKGKDAACTEDGSKDYYECKCGEWFADEACREAIADHDSIVIPAKGHTLTKTEAKAATCTEGGNIEYFVCSECSKVFKDSEAKSETALEDTVLKAKGHSLEKVEAKAATETQEGNTEYWKCSECGKLYKDAEGKTEITLADTVIPKVETVLKGDVNGDGRITLVDAKWILQHVADMREFDEKQFKAAEMNGDSKITVTDAKAVLKIIAGI